MITQETWRAMPSAERNRKLTEALCLLRSIREHTHELCGKREQGRLRQFRTDTEQFVLNVLQWEAPNNPTDNNT